MQSSSGSLLDVPSELSLFLLLQLPSDEELFGDSGIGEEDDWKLLSEPSLWHEAGLEAELEELITYSG
ncbi:UNVERIFIED_CONTAM: hypothetical protein K2H54_043222 [Gekko kuhli]